MEMSLDDIIQKKKKQNVRTQWSNQHKQQKQLFDKTAPITDARNKIIFKKRTQITDAREKLAELAKQKDARLKLESLRRSRAKIWPPEINVHREREKVQRTFMYKDRVFADKTRQVVSHPLAKSKVIPGRQIQAKQITRDRLIQPKFRENIPVIKPIVRTVENDIEIIDDPMGDEYIPQKPSSLNRKASLQLKIIAHNNDAQNSRGAIHTTIHRTSIPEKEKSPPRPPSILKKRPMVALGTDNKAQKTEKNVLEYRIIVSNLRNTVTGSDIEELFGDVGGMVVSRLVRPGTAEVVYKTQEDAQRAVDLYHNRQLDGQPMNCLLVTPRSPSATTRSGTIPALYSTNSNVEPDISTFHKVLFSNL